MISTLNYCFFINRPKHQLVLNIGVDRILDLLFNNKEILPIKLTEIYILIHKFDRLLSAECKAKSVTRLLCVCVCVCVWRE